MDPITCAARRFLHKMDELWEEDRRFVRMIVDDEDRGELLKALRLGEAMPANRRPLFLIQHPFVEPQSYFTQMSAQIGYEYEQIRRGAADEGVTLPPLPVGTSGTRKPLEAIEQAVLAIECVANQLSEHLDGALVALVPAHIENPLVWQQSIRRFLEASPPPGYARGARSASARGARSAYARGARSASARVAIRDDPEGLLRSIAGWEGARFRVDRKQMITYMKKLVAKGSLGPAIPSPHVRPKTDELGRLLLDAAEQMADDDPSGAAELYERAIALCQADKLALEEACLHVALAGALLAAGDAPSALATYQRAVDLGEQNGAPQIACQGRFGMAGAAFALKRYKAANAAYEAAALAAERASLPPLAAEATRMMGICAGHPRWSGPPQAASEGRSG